MISMCMNTHNIVVYGGGMNPLHWNKILPCYPEPTPFVADLIVGMVIQIWRS